MAVLPDGKFILAGVTVNSPSTAYGWVRLARFNANGTLDSSFGNEGTVLTTIGVRRESTSLEHPLNIAVDGSGRIVVAGSTTGASSDFLVARFNANGALDTTFGAARTGVVTTTISSGSHMDRAYALTVQSDGKIVVGGFASANSASVVPAALVRYNTDGSLDATFDEDGIATALLDDTPENSSTATVRAVIVQADGKILLAGDGLYGPPRGDGGYDYSDGMLFLMRFNADGSRDNSYGPSGSGLVMTSLGFNANASAMDLQADGQAVVVGRMNTNGPSATDPSPYVESFALVRFLGSSASPSPVQIGSFVASSNTVAAGSPVTLTAGGVTTASAGATITRVAFYYVDSSGTEQFLGDGTENADGTWTLAFTANLPRGRYTLLALAVDSTGAVSDPFSLGLEVV